MYSSKTFKHHRQVKEKQPSKHLLLCLGARQSTAFVGVISTIQDTRLDTLRLVTAGDDETGPGSWSRAGCGAVPYLEDTFRCRLRDANGVRVQGVALVVGDVSLGNYSAAGLVCRNRTVEGKRSLEVGDCDAVDGPWGHWLRQSNRV